jgi:hypothetical protein
MCVQNTNGYSITLNRWFLEPSVRLSFRPSVSYCSAAIAPRELKFSTLVCCFTVYRFGVRGLGVRESGLDQDPYQKKYTSTGITRVPVVQIEQMGAHLKGLSERIVMSSEFMVTCTSGLLPNPANVPYFQYRA